MNSTSETEQEIKDLEQAFAQALLDGDIAFLDRVLSDEVIFTNFQGNLTSKAEDLAPLRSKALIITTYTAQDITIKAYGNIAIVNLGLNIAGTFNAQPFAGQYRYTRTYLKTDTWQVIAAQATPMTP